MSCHRVGLLVCPGALPPLGQRPVWSKPPLPLWRLWHLACAWLCQEHLEPRRGAVGGPAGYAWREREPCLGLWPCVPMAVTLALV